jgi:NAD(P)-dependent dehydrogenase (short-subunit alcohol dehydrogenase family)
MTPERVFRHKIALLTGAGSGLGRGMAELLGQYGATVIVTDLDAASAQQVAERIVAQGGEAASFGLDVRQAEAFEQLVMDVVAKYQRLDYLFNNAGVGISGETQKLTLAQWQKVLAVNLHGVVNGVAVAYPIMVEQGFGHIVNTASLAGLAPFPTAVPYAATKTAVVGLSRSLRIEAAEFGVKVSAICPGFVDTQIYQNADLVGIRLDALLQTIPFKIIPTDQAVRTILRGVSRNQTLIVFPFYARLLWFLVRYCYPLVSWIGRDTFRKFIKKSKD